MERVKALGLLKRARQAATMEGAVFRDFPVLVRLEGKEYPQSTVSEVSRPFREVWILPQLDEVIEMLEKDLRIQRGHYPTSRRPL